MDVKDSGVSRRQALRTGMYVAGAAWVVPAITVIGATAAHADSPSGPTPTPPPTTRPTDETPTETPTSTPSPSDTPTPSGTSSTAPQPSGTASSPTVLGTHATKGPPGSVQAQSGGGLGALPRTGTEVASIGLLGTALVAGGLAAKAATRRHDDETDAPAS